MKLPLASERYDRQEQNRTRAIIEQEDGKNRKQNADVEIGVARLILTSSGGKRFKVVVDDTGALSTVAL